MSQHSSPLPDAHRASEHIREEERRRIAHDLHDELGSHLTAIKMALARLRAQLQQQACDLDALKTQCDYADTLTDGALHAMHEIIDDLHPPILELGLPAALEWLGRSFARQSGVSHHVQIDRRTTDLPLEMLQIISLYRIAREALHNAARHAAARQLTMTLRLELPYLLMEIADDGIGLPAAAATDRPGSGLLGMQIRATTIGAQLTWLSSEGDGTKLQVRLPTSAFTPANLIK
jgi:signal transduction histidine kinase